MQVAEMKEHFWEKFKTRILWLCWCANSVFVLTRFGQNWLSKINQSCLRPRFNRTWRHSARCQLCPPTSLWNWINFCKFRIRMVFIFILLLNPIYKAYGLIMHEYSAIKFSILLVTSINNVYLQVSKLSH